MNVSTVSAAQDTGAKPCDISATRDLCWGLLFHMLGLPQQAKDRFSELSSDGDSSEAKALKKLVRAVGYYQSARKPERRLELHRRIAIAADFIINPDQGDCSPQLSRECPRCSDHRQAKDGPEAGYSRDPFKVIAEDHKPAVALSAMLYLIRAHSLFFCRSRGERSFNVAKVALNDLFQANQLACRLYYSLGECHFRHYTQDSYMESVRNGPDTTGYPWHSPYFTWSALELVAIQRGNIYRQINYIEEADRYYRHAKKRFLQLARNPFAVTEGSIIKLKTEIGTGDSPDQWFATSTLVRMLFEHSKVLFDRGLFLESMLHQVYCLALLVRMTGQGKAVPAATHADLAHLEQGLRSLEVLRREAVWNKEFVHLLFGYEEEKAEGALPEQAPLSVLLERGFLRSLRGPTAGLATDLYTRLGFTLFIFRRGHQRLAGDWSRDQIEDATSARSKFFDWLKRFFETHKVLGQKQVPLARYCLSILREGEGGRRREKRADSYSMPVFRESAERELAHHLRVVLASDPGFERPLNETSFYRALLDITTQNMLNIVTIPRRVQSFFLRMGYKERRLRGDLSGRRVSDPLRKKNAPRASSPPGSGVEGNRKPGLNSMMRDKLVVLRRWQSFNPKIPRPEGRTVRGGGYFLLWKGKGIVIDPGYDFLQNFYDEGFSLDDINAVVVTHSHPDHEDDLSTLSTLVREWNEHYRHLGYASDRLVKLDIFLNESAHLKFSGWLKSSGEGVARIIPLPLVVWDIGSEDPGEAIRGENVLLDLRREYNLQIEVVPAWHDDVIGKTAAIGLKFHLYGPESTSTRVGLLGYTGDTGAYPWPAGDEDSRDSVENHYKNCDVLVAHLGDVRLRELFTSIGKPKINPAVCTCVNDVLTSWFCEADGKQLLHDRVTSEQIENFFSLLVTLNIAPRAALETQVGTSNGAPVTVAAALNEYIHGRRIDLEGFRTYPEIEVVLSRSIPEGADRLVKATLERHLSAAGGVGPEDEPLDDSRIAYSLLGFVCALSLMPWKYHYHLGISGIYRLHRAMIDSFLGGEVEEQGDRSRIFIVGELPEELASYRHHVARLLNATEGNHRDGRRKVHALTGDIGLHVALDLHAGKDSEKILQPKVRCIYCNYNNETVLRKEGYHPPEQILETPLKRLDSAMIYLCTRYDHHPELETRPYEFLSRPSLRVI